MTHTLTSAAGSAACPAQAGIVPFGALQPPLVAYKQRILIEPVHISCGISSQSGGEQDQLLNEAPMAACLLLDQEALDRLYILWNALDELACDEISDWTLRVNCSVSAAGNRPAPVLLATAATVYANGEVAFALTVAEHASQLWFDETLNLGDFLDRPQPTERQGTQRSTCEGANTSDAAHGSTGG
jgi:hypothetical protein